MRTLQLAIEVGAEKKNNQRQPDPGEETHHRAERAIDAVVTAEVLDIPGEHRRTRNPERRGGDAAPCQPVTLTAAAIRRVMIDKSVEHNRQQEDPGPPENGRQPGDLGVRIDQACHGREQRDQLGEHRAENQDHDHESDGGGDDAEIAALLAHLERDVQAFDQRAHAAARAPQRNDEADDERETDPGRLHGGEAREFRAQHLHRAAGEQARQTGELVHQRAAVAEYAVDRGQRSDAGKQREQDEERHAGRDRGNAVLHELVGDIGCDREPARLAVLGEPLRDHLRAAFFAAATGVACSSAVQLASFARPGSMNGMIAANGVATTPRTTAAPAWTGIAPLAIPTLGLLIGPLTEMGARRRKKVSFLGWPESCMSTRSLRISTLPLPVTFITSVSKTRLRALNTPPRAPKSATTQRMLVCLSPAIRKARSTEMPSNSANCWRI